ncbi:MAG: hypothetical protein P1V97_04790 [Planctomycetota bacterium]|nr:hypothetical protein [Planctomycetota bacterium]
MKLHHLIPTLSIAALLFFGGTAIAQDGEPKMPDMPKDDSALPKTPKKGKKGKKGKKNGKRGRLDPRTLMKDLNLTDEQKAPFAAAAKEMREKIRAMREAGGTPDRRKVAEARREFMKKLQGFLSEDQQAKLKGMGQGRKKGQKRGQQGRQMGQNPEELMQKVKEILVLAPTDEAKVMPLIEKIASERKALIQMNAKNRAALLVFLKEGSTSEETEAKVAEFRKARDEKEKAIKTAQDELSKAVDKEQQAKLVALGILR